MLEKLPELEEIQDSWLDIKYSNIFERIKEQQVNDK